MGFFKKISKNAFCKLFFAIPLCFMSMNRCTFMFFASALTQCCPSIARYKRKRVTQPSSVNFSLRCARQVCKSKIFSALRAPDTREKR